MKKAIYLPTNQNIIITEEFDEYCEILLDGEYKTVNKNEIEFISIDNIISPLSNFKENIFINCVKNPLDDILYSYNTNRLTPEPHQYKPLIKFLNSQNYRVLIADEVGLGKTIEAGMIYKEIDKREELKISLIVVPSSLTVKWKEELLIRFDEDFEIYKTNQFLNFIDEVERYSSSKVFHEKIIISYHTLRDEKVMQKLQNSFFEVDFLVMDEAHTMRNEDTSTFESAKIITSLSEHIVFLTATPIQNRLQDLFNILYLLDNDYFRDYEYFCQMIEPNPVIHKLIALFRNNASLSNIKEFIHNYKNTIDRENLQNIFNKILSLNALTVSDKIHFINELIKADYLSFIINRTKKKDVGLVTPRHASSFIVEITKEEKEYYDAVINFVKFLYPHVPQGFITIMPERMASSSMIASLNSFKKIKDNKKIIFDDIEDLDDYYSQINIQEKALEYLNNIIQKGEAIGQNDSKFLKFEELIKDLHSKDIRQMIVFSFFKKTLDYLEIKLKDLGYKIGKIHGDLSVEERFSKIKDFKNKEFDILLSSEVGSEGLDMQFCNVVINYDLPWNPMRVEQRIGRIDRIGQKFDKLHIFNLCIIGSIEDRIYNRLYNKLNIFEESIGELEPILGNLEKELNISEILNLSDEEIEKKLNLETLAMERKKLEISQHIKEFDKMLNNDLNFQKEEKNFFNNKKINFLQNQTKKIITNFFKENDINFQELKSGLIKLSSKNTKLLFNTLKPHMSDKKKESLKYKEEKELLIKINRSPELKISFETNNSDDLNTIFINISNPIILMISKQKNFKNLTTIATHKKYKNSYAVVYRLDLKSLKEKSYIKVLLLDDSFNYLEEKDFFDFIADCEEKEIESNEKLDFNLIKNKAFTFWVKNIEKIKDNEKQELHRLIDIKIHSVKSYFDKKIKKTKQLQKKVEQKDIIKMRKGEISNIIEQRDKKIQELESAKEVTSSFEILGVVKVV